MKKIILSLKVMLAATLASAQLGNYQFSAQAGTYTPIDSMGGLAVQDHSVQDDFITPDKVKLPFSFDLGAGAFDSVGLSENGFLYFGNIRNWELGSSWPISSVLVSDVKGVISPVGLDLHPVQLPGQNTTLRTAIAGTAPNRIFIAEWRGTSRFDALNDPSGPDDISFQVKLYEKDGQIDFVYGTFVINPTYTEAVEIGLKGSTYNDYINRVPTANWLLTSAGVTQNSRGILDGNSAPARGTTYSWKKATVTGIGNKGTEQAWSVFPVPSEDNLQITVPHPEALTYSIVDMTGKQVASGTCHNNLSIATLSAGIYWLHIRGAKTYLPKMIVRQ